MLTEKTAKEIYLILKAQVVPMVTVIDKEMAFVYKAGLFGKPVICINLCTNFKQKLLLLCHELCHIYLFKNRVATECHTDSEKVAQQRAFRLLRDLTGKEITKEDLMEINDSIQKLFARHRSKIPNRVIVNGQIIYDERTGSSF